MPLPATRSRTLTATATASAAAAWSPLSMVISAFLTKVLADETYGRLRTRRRSATRIRFSADLLFANCHHLVYPSQERIKSRGARHARLRQLSYQKTVLHSSQASMPW